MKGLRSKLSNVKNMPYSEISDSVQNLQDQVICQKMATFDQLNDHFLVNSKKRSPLIKDYKMAWSKRTPMECNFGPSFCPYMEKLQNEIGFCVPFIS